MGEDGSRIQGTRLRNATGEMIMNQISCCVIIMIQHRESKVPKWELGGRIFQLNFNIFFENISDNGT